MRFHAVWVDVHTVVEQQDGKWKRRSEEVVDTETQRKQKRLSERRQSTHAYVRRM